MVSIIPTVKSVDPSEACFVNTVVAGIADHAVRWRLMIMLRKCFSFELLLFIEAVQAFKAAEDPTIRLTLAKDIISRFIVSGSDFQVNISELHRREIMEHSQGAEMDKRELRCMFDDAEEEVAKLLTHNFLRKILEDVGSRVV